ncbi:MAG: hydrogenase expression/formation protein HypE [Deltaproteobacteria bacterium]|nr:hydrogenase expression/formation protein HypE [Deltaproteobacteria bacterium]OQX62250.1 MAG: hydrogenase expression/formation protein HypE [Desulfococcus sp. 4484_242]
MKKPQQITLDHGAGGEASHELVHDIFLKRLDNEFLHHLDDSAVLDLTGGRFAMTTDSYVVDPIFFPGGDIGSLAVHGTINDLSMQGATPLYLTLGLILEEGFPIADLTRIMDSVAEAGREAGVKVVAGDTKVVPKGKMDRVFINTAGIGSIPEGVEAGSHNARPGDLILINGCIGDHGIAVLATREGLDFQTELKSDSAPLNGLVSAVLKTSSRIHVLRDPTRGGVATALNEIAGQSGVGITLFEDALPVSKPVLAASELLGLDPLYLANEGKCLMVVDPDDADALLGTLKQEKYGKKAAIIGEVSDKNPGRVLLKTRVGGARILTMLTGEQLPRIC